MAEQAATDLIVRTPFLTALNEWVRSAIAISIIAGGITLILMDFLDAQIDGNGLVTIFVGLMGAVLGYYFGKTGTDHAQATAVKALQTREHLEEKADEALKTLREDYAAQNELLGRIMQDIEESGSKDLIRRVASRIPNGD